MEELGLKKPPAGEGLGGLPCLGFLREASGMASMREAEGIMLALERRCEDVCGNFQCVWKSRVLTKDNLVYTLKALCVLWWATQVR